MQPSIAYLVLSPILSSYAFFEHRQIKESQKQSKKFLLTESWPLETSKLAAKRKVKENTLI